MEEESQRENETAQLNGESSVDDDYNNAKFSTYEIAKLFITFFFYVLDTGTDTFLAYDYYKRGDYIYFGYTLFFVLVSPLPTVCSNVRDFWISPRSPRVPETWAVRTTRVVCTGLFPLAVYPRFLDYYIYGKNFAKKKTAGEHDEARKYFALMNEEWRIVTFIRLREAFLESAPQLVLHLYIIAKTSFRSLGFCRTVPMYLSLLSLAWTLASSRPLLRSLPLNETEEKQSTADQEDSMPREEESTPEQVESTPEQEESTWLGTLLLTIAHIFAIAGRCIPLSVTGSVALKIAAAHALVLFLTIWARKTDVPVVLFAEKRRRFVNRVTKLSSLALLALISVFGYFHNRTAIPHTIYWTICVIENAIMLTIYMLTHSAESERLPFRVTVLIIHAVLSLFSILLFALFYRYEQNINERAKRVNERFAAMDCFASEDQNRVFPRIDEIEMQPTPNENAPEG